MAILTLVDGKKGPGDILVLVTSYDSPLTFSEILFINKCVLDSEEMYYPIDRGNIGKAMFLNALNELACGVDFDRVLERYKLKKKGKAPLNVVDKRKSKTTPPAAGAAPAPTGAGAPTKLVEMLEH